jgi:hypothetical protein
MWYLQALHDAATELIKVIELEKSGPRDGDGTWHDGDPLGGNLEIIEETGKRFLALDRKIFNARNKIGSASLSRSE